VENTPEHAAAGTFRLMYRSHARIPDERRKAELGEIFSKARSNNKKRDITGALLIDGEKFVQVLEGDETAVRELYTRIAADSRHEQVALLEDHTVPARVFTRWSMAKVAADGEPDIPLLMNRDRGGASPAAPRRSTPEQDELLDRMHTAARAG
jgi:hypothetical protein